MHRVTLAGDQLGSFIDGGGLEWPAFTTTGFDDDLRVILPYPGEEEPVLPVIVDGQVTFAEGRRPLARAYTVRGFDAATGRLDLDFYLHDGGVASDWARMVQAGASVHLAGPGVLHGAAPENTPLLAVGDETAMPALARLLEELPAQAQGVIVAVARDSAYLRDLDRPSGVDLVAMEPSDAGATLEPHPAIAVANGFEPLLDAFIWIAGEQDGVTALRRHLVTELAVPKEHVEFSGYWRRAGSIH